MSATGFLDDGATLIIDYRPTSAAIRGSNEDPAIQGLLGTP